MCTLTIVGMIGAMAFSGFGKALTGYALMRESGIASMQAELALVRLQKELSTATYDVQHTGSSISFLRPDAATMITITLSDGNLTLATNGQTAVLLQHVEAGSPFISVSEQTVNGTTSPALITLTFRLRTESGDTTYSLSVSPRNTPPAST